jgi:hypothetical protein
MGRPSRRAQRASRIRPSSDVANRRSASLSRSATASTGAWLEFRVPLWISGWRASARDRLPPRSPNRRGAALPGCSQAGEGVSAVGARRGDGSRPSAWCRRGLTEARDRCGDRYPRATTPAPIYEPSPYEPAACEPRPCDGTVYQLAEPVRPNDDLPGALLRGDQATAPRSGRARRTPASLRVRAPPERALNL